MKKKNGNLLVTFIMVVAFSMIVYVFVSFVGVRLKESSIRVSDVESFYVAEAGLNKAIWYLATPVASGGKGLAWRTTGTNEAYGWGRYYITVQNYTVTGEVMIISTGEVGGILKTIMQRAKIGGLPTAFDYAIFTNAPLNMSGNAQINGDAYVDGNTIFIGNGEVTGGSLYHPIGTTISGHGTWTDGREPTPIPEFPQMDTSYYEDLITTAQGVAAGNKTYNNSTYDLNGGTVYVKGNVTISGNTTFNGPGVIVATGTINMSGNTYSSNTIKFISGGAGSLSGNTYTDGAIYYSSTSLKASGNTRVNVGGFLSHGTTTLSGNVNMSGIIYSSGTITLSGNPVITGTVVSGATDGITGLSGNAKITYDNSVFPDEIPLGFTATELTRIRGTWREL